MTDSTSATAAQTAARLEADIRRSDVLLIRFTLGLVLLVCTVMVGLVVVTL